MKLSDPAEKIQYIKFKWPSYVASLQKLQEIHSSLDTEFSFSKGFDKNETISWKNGILSDIFDLGEFLDALQNKGQL